MIDPRLTRPINDQQVSGLETAIREHCVLLRRIWRIAQSTGPTSGKRRSRFTARKTVMFESELDQATGVDLVKIKNIGVDHTPFRIEHDPGSPAADSKGFVKLPNVNMIMEMADPGMTPAEVTVLSTDGVLLAAGDD